MSDRPRPVVLGPVLRWLLAGAGIIDAAMMVGENRSCCPAGHLRLALVLAGPKRAKI